jgi:uncharacterized protein (TIGR02217 family)
MFLEERLDLPYRFGSSFSSEYEGNITVVRGGNDHTSLENPYPRLTLNLDLTNKTETELMEKVHSLWDRVGGMYGGSFRVKNPVQYSTNNRVDSPGFNDQACVKVADGVYQAMLWLRDEADSTSTRRRLKKPVVGTMHVGIRDDFNNPVLQKTGFSVDYTTGEITFDANVSSAIEGISNAAQAVVQITGHSHTVNQTLHFSAVVGMTEINGLRATVLAVTPNTLTVDLDTTGFSTYTSGGDVNTQPQSGETPTSGCYFDIPMRFDVEAMQATMIARNSRDLILGAVVPFIETRNPS